ncbi:hypothetical protein MKW98_025522 [Papaver atlanticum]|uniref:Uncharacterized protein n=1 Tax=Papaver atlanticum TaxID=357466 RepID=A0AAD4SBP1_9MAGN|nr:hypothetical protein MKW98_025522 [Papaver atlanticum]
MLKQRILSEWEFEFQLGNIVIHPASNLSKELLQNGVLRYYYFLVHVQSKNGERKSSLVLTKVGALDCVTFCLKVRAD